MTSIDSIDLYKYIFIYNITMRYIKQFENWRRNKNTTLLVEAVVHIDNNIVELLKSFDKHSNKNFITISKVLIDAIGKDYPKNKYDLVSKSLKEPNKFDVKSGKHTNPLGISKVVRNLLISFGIEVGKGDIKDDTIQKFSDELIGKLKLTDAKSIGGELKLVSGDEIPKYYNSENTVLKKGSELNNSCMGGTSKNDLLEIYKLNPDKVNLLVKLVNGKVDARGLVWKLDYSSGGNKWYLDRCYCNDNSDKETLFEWLKKEKGEVVSRMGDVTGAYYNAESKTTDIVKLNKVLTNFYPYIDTFFSLIIKKEGNELNDIGIVTNNSKLLIDGEEHIRKLGDDYNWLLDPDSYVQFSCRSTKGERTSVDPEKSMFNNETKKVKVVGYKFEVKKGKPLDGFRNMSKIIDMLSEIRDPSVLFELETTSSDVSGLYNFNGMYFDEKECVRVISGSLFPYCLTAKVFNVDKLYDDNVMIETKKGPISFRKIFDQMKQVADLVGGESDFNNENNEFGKAMTELDFYILGIHDKMDNSIEGKTWTYVDINIVVSSNKTTDMLKKLFGESEYTKLREKLRENQDIFSDKEWMKLKSKLMSN